MGSAFYDSSHFNLPQRRRRRRSWILSSVIEVVKQKQYNNLAPLVTMFIFSLAGLYPQTDIRHGIVNDNHIRVRDSPGLDGSIIGSLSKGDKAYILGRSKNRMYLDGFDSF
jgi:uncharacterized protein (UPF0297 family)